MNDISLTPNYKSVLLPTSVAVIILSHNYGCFLDECIKSVKAQTVLPFECIVVADTCDPDDLTEVIAKGHGLKVYPVIYGNTLQSRAAGLQFTRSPFIMYLDADDSIAPTYIEETLAPLLRDPRVGIVGTHLMRSGECLYHEKVNINRQNWLHSGSMTRRTCLTASEVFEHFVGQQSHADWYMWRKILNDGWFDCVINKPIYNYRVHSNNQSIDLKKRPYYELAALYAEPVTLVIPFCRTRYWDRLSDWLITNAIDYDKVLIIDSSEIQCQVARDLSYLPGNTCHIKLKTNGDLADRARSHNSPTYLDIQDTMPRIYKHLNNVTTEYMMIIEDDVLPPNGSITRLLESMDHNVAAVSGNVKSRFQNRVIAGHNFDDEISESITGTGVTGVGYTGFGCLLLRRSALYDAGPFKCGNFDMMFCKELKEKGWRWLINWDLTCVHGDIPVDLKETNDG